MARKVRYQVLKPVFVNGSLIDPAAAKGGGPVFVMADEGLEGSALKLAPGPGRPPKREESAAASGSEPPAAGAMGPDLLSDPAT